MSPKKHSAMMVFLGLSLTIMPFAGAFATTEATSLQNQALKSEQSAWLAHATMSCVMWRQANLYDAIREGKEACQLAPDNTMVLMNLALMLQSTDDYFYRGSDIENSNGFL